MGVSGSDAGDEVLNAKPRSCGPRLRIACDAMCGGLARWLRVLGHDTFYREGIDDQELVDLALAEDRVVITSDSHLLERRLFTNGQLPAVSLPRGLGLDEQLDFVAGALRLTVGKPRCTRCNGELIPTARDEVADVVPARSLIWAKEFFKCQACAHVFWEGTHWRRISNVRRRVMEMPWNNPGGEPPTA